WPPGADRPSLPRRFRAAEDFADLPEQAAALGTIRDLLLGLGTRASRATVAEVIEEACAATDFEAVCLTQFQGARKVANVRKLIEQARLFYVACTRAQDVLVLLEGKGDARYLREEKGERHVWCHQVWDVLERARVAAFVASGLPEETLALAGGGTVRLERAGLYREPPGAGARVPEPRVAPAGEAERA